MEWEKNKTEKYICKSKIKDVVYSISETDGLFLVGLTRIPNKENDFLSRITGRIGRDLEIFLNGIPYHGSIIAKSFSFDVAKTFASLFEDSIIKTKGE